LDQAIPSASLKQQIFQFAERQDTMMNIFAEPAACEEQAPVAPAISWHADQCLALAPQSGFRVQAHALRAGRWRGPVRLRSVLSRRWRPLVQRFPKPLNEVWRPYR